MKIVLLIALLLTIVLLHPPVHRGEDRLLGPPYTYFTFTFTEQGQPQAGVTAILIDGSNREWKETSNFEGEVRFVIKAKSGLAFLTYWKGETVPVFKKAFEYTAGNHYRFRLKLKK